MNVGGIVYLASEALPDMGCIFILYRENVQRRRLRMNGFRFGKDDLDLSKDKLIDGIIYHALEFDLLDREKEDEVRGFLQRRITDSTNYVAHKTEWDSKRTNPDKFMYLCVLAEVRPSELTPWLKNNQP